jgi:hypothetical protein
LLKTGHNGPDLTFLAEINLLNVELLRVGMWLTLDNLAHTDVTLRENIKFLGKRALG